MRADRSRSRKASGIIDPDFERKSGNGTDARHRHQTAANSVVLNHLKKHAMQSFVALEDCPPDVQRGLNHHRKGAPDYQFMRHAKQSTRWRSFPSAEREGRAPALVSAVNPLG